MKVSDSADKIHSMIEKAIADHRLTRAEYDAILHEATKDGFVDSHEQALLSELKDMIEDRTVKLIP